VPYKQEVAGSSPASPTIISVKRIIRRSLGCLLTKIFVSVNMFRESNSSKESVIVGSQHGELQCEMWIKKEGVMRTFVLALFLFLVCAPAQAAMSLRPLPEGHTNEIGMSLSYGIKLDKDALFWGYAPDYVRVFRKKWLLNLSLAYDEETETKNGSQSVTETWTPSAIIGYQVNPRVAVGCGFGHGVVENKSGGGWKSVKFGDDLSGALAFACSLWSKDRHGLALSISLEYNFSDDQTSISTDLGYGWAF